MATYIKNNLFFSLSFPRKLDVNNNYGAVTALVNLWYFLKSRKIADVLLVQLTNVCRRNLSRSFNSSICDCRLPFGDKEYIRSLTSRSTNLRIS